MGYARWSNDDWNRYSRSTRGRATEELFGSRGLHPDLDPSRIMVRESRDSDVNPTSTPLILGLDVTGSMGMIADALARKGLGSLIEDILDTQPVTDPHIMVMGIGDAAYDRAPLQVSQFEADIRIAQQLTQLWLEKGGGGNEHESYTLPWYFAATRTETDAWDKRRRKGLLFTVGDEFPPPVLPAAQIKRVLGDEVTQDLRTEDLLAAVQERWTVFHVIIAEGHFARRRLTEVHKRWSSLLGQRALVLDRHTQLPGLIVRTLEAEAGITGDITGAAGSNPANQPLRRLLGRGKGSGSAPPPRPDPRPDPRDLA